MYLAHPIARRDAQPDGATGGLQPAGDGVFRGFGRVVFSGQVRKQNVRRAVFDAVQREVRRRFVGEMPVFAKNPPFEMIGVRAALQHAHIMIGFQQQQINARQRFGSVIGDVAGIGQRAESCLLYTSPSPRDRG